MKKTRTYREEKVRPLESKTVITMLRQQMAGPFDFSADSVILSQIVHQAVRTFAQWHEGNQDRRLDPHHLVVDYLGQRNIVPLINREIIEALYSDHQWSQVYDKINEDLYRHWLLLDGQVRLDDVRVFLSPHMLSPSLSRSPSSQKRHVDGSDWTPLESDMDFDRLRSLLSLSDRRGPVERPTQEVPQEMMDRLVPLIREESRSQSSAELMVRRMYELWCQMCPPVKDMQPGQCMALAVDVTDRQLRLSVDKRRHIPVLLTVYTPAEVESLKKKNKISRDQIEDLLALRVARLLSESYAQGGLLTLNQVALLLHLSPGKVGNLVNRFEHQHRVVLPTPGTIHDMGTKFTHKALIIGFHLQGYDTREIAKITYHSPEAVSVYIRAFETVLLLMAHKMPESIIPMVMRIGKTVVDQYIDIIRKRIGDSDAVIQYVNKCNLIGHMNPQHTDNPNDS